jgi:hypothetical protein
MIGFYLLVSTNPLLKLPLDLFMENLSVKSRIKNTTVDISSSFSKFISTLYQ